MSLVGTSRSVSFEPGLNVVAGPITGGKTSLLRLCRGLLGAPLEDFPVEVREHVSSLGGRILIGDEAFAVVRPFTTTPTAVVEIAGRDESARLPALRLDATASETYGHWLLRKLGLPRLDVPSAPTQPESGSTPVSINDYMSYCDLPQDEIDSSVFGHRQPFKNIKRKYVFEILFGIYGVEIAALQEELRTIIADMRQLEAQTDAFRRFLKDSPLENRAELDYRLEEAEEELRRLESEMVASSQESQGPANVADLRIELARVDDLRSEAQQQLDLETQSVRQLRQLEDQLRTQSARLTRAIVAETYLLDFEFSVCPRCGTPVTNERGSDEVCLLCLQAPSPSIDREQLVAEQNRISAQIIETKELMNVHSESVAQLEREIQQLIGARERVARELDFLLKTYVSDSAETIAQRASHRGQILGRIEQLKEYRTLLDRLDEALGDLSLLTERRLDIQGRLEVVSARRSEAEGRVRAFEEAFEATLQAFGIPRFSDPPSSRIDRQTYLPIVDDRRFEQVSSQGLKVLVNMAYALALHQTSIAIGLALPSILFIDGPSSNVGHEGYDYERITDVYRHLIRLHESFGDVLQLIVADNDVPDFVEDFVRLRVTERERLIPV